MLEDAKDDDGDVDDDDDDDGADGADNDCGIGSKFYRRRYKCIPHIQPTHAGGDDC